VEIDYI